MNHIRRSKISSAVLMALTLSSSMAYAATTTGPTGPAGPAGAKGATGPAGPTGAKGATGAVGPTGAQGPIGPTGATGIQGATGATGVGAVGATGATGPQGPAGADGATGPAGSGGSFSYSMTCGTHTPQDEACKVGAVGPGGGWIFFVDKDDEYPGFDYLEAAPADISAVAWCDNVTTSIPAVAGWSARAVGAGQANTTAMLGVCSTGAANSAAAYSTPTTQAGDWFLGTLGDMMLMYTNLSYAGVGGFASSYYWSSSEYDTYYAWYQGFSNGLQGYYGKYIALPVRAVRAF